MNALIDQLVKQGVELFCLSPGRRSTPLVMAVANHPKAKTFVHFDERGTAFHALGYGKATGKPAAVIVTSGSALGNLMPAVMEASASQVPMLLLTADRPPELLDTMANQTCDQIKIFGSYVTHTVHLPTPASLPENYLAKTLSHAVQRTQFPYKGPVHINCPFREPFDGGASFPPGEGTETTYGNPSLSEADALKWAQILGEVEKGVIVIGAHNPSTHTQIEELSRTLDWPIFPDPISSFRDCASDQTILHFPYLLTEEEKPDLLLHFGGPTVSKPLLQWTEGIPRVVHVAGHPKRLDPLHFVTDRIFADPNLFAEALLPHLKSHPSGYVAEWRKKAEIAEEVLSTLAGELTEMGIFWTLKDHLSPDQALFIGNSMPIRDADTLLFPKAPSSPIFANRGLSGIDGNIGTCAGIAQTRPVLAIMGDQTLLHDLNSLAQLTKTPHPVKIIVINNQGGRIFSFFKPDGKEEVWNEFMHAEHPFTFEKAAQLFSLPYQKITRPEELIEKVQGEGSALIEIPTSPRGNVDHHQKIRQTIQDALCSFSSTVS